MATKIPFLFLCLSLSLLVTSFGFELSLKDKEDAKFGWKFSKNRHFLYFNSTEDIAQSLLPVKITNLPARQGVWLLRYKDFLELPYSYSYSGLQKNGHSSATVSFASSAIFFTSIRIKFYIHGKASLNLLTSAGHTEPKYGHFEENTSTPKKHISLGGAHFFNCTNSTKSESSFQWANYEIKISDEGAAHMELQINIEETKSFVILDEISVRFYENFKKSNLNSTDIAKTDNDIDNDIDNDDETYNWSGENIPSKHINDLNNDDSYFSRRKLYKIICTVENE